MDPGNVDYSLSEESTPSSSNRQLSSPLAFITGSRLFGVSLSRVDSPDDSSISSQLLYNPWSFSEASVLEDSTSLTLERLLPCFATICLSLRVSSPRWSQHQSWLAPQRHSYCSRWVWSIWTLWESLPYKAYPYSFLRVYTQQAEAILHFILPPTPLSQVLRYLPRFFWETELLIEFWMDTVGL